MNDIIRKGSRFTLALGTGLLAWGLLMRADAGNRAPVWYALEIAGVIMVAVALPCYVYARYVRGRRPT
jgi:hypothetical protein